MSKRVLVTAALPYANGSIHLGHVLEAVQTDIYVRARRMMGDDVVFAWADDTHGTAIQVRATRDGITPEEVIGRAYKEHVADFTDLQISFDIYHTTHSEESKRHTHALYEAMRDRGLVETREIEQLFCPHDAMFLPDRFVRGTCPKCGSEDQYGDVCEVCGTTYAPTELKSPRCAICGTQPILKSSQHLFVGLAQHEAFLREWLKGPDEGGLTQIYPTVKNYVARWIEDGLRDWDVSRDAPYFGFEIPGYAGKYFYVWFDAPIGYIAATQAWCDREGKDFDSYWRTDRSKCEIVHVIGKDIVYFHTLFWPVMLNSSGYTTPTRVQVHGWVTINGSKMSKSEGTFILARTYLEHLSPDYLRYYYAAKLSAAQDDIDLSFDDFSARVNAEMVNKAANLASRCIKFVTARLGGTLAALPDDALELCGSWEAKVAQAYAHYKEFESAAALRLAMEIAESANTYVTDAAPWKLATSDPERARSVCSVGVHASKLIVGILAPVLPSWKEKLERTLALPAPLTAANATSRLPAGHAIREYETLCERIDPAKVKAILEASSASIGGLPLAQDGSAAVQAAPATNSDAISAAKSGAKSGAKSDAHANTSSAPATAKQVAEPNSNTTQAAGADVVPLAAETTIDAFGAVDLRVGRVIACEAVPEAAKLLRLTVDLGPLGQRNIFSGIKASYEPSSLLGKLVVVFANLKPRKMRFGMSEGMILAAGQSDDAVTVLELDPRAVPGDRIS